jgi:hypothetical protein
MIQSRMGRHPCSTKAQNVSESRRDDIFRALISPMRTIAPLRPFAHRIIITSDRAKRRVEEYLVDVSVLEDASGLTFP